MQYAELPSNMAYSTFPCLYPAFSSLISPEFLVDAYQNEIFACGLAANAVVLFVKSVPSSVSIAKNPAIKRFSFCFMCSFLLNLRIKKERHKFMAYIFLPSASIRFYLSVTSKLVIVCAACRVNTIITDVEYRICFQK